MSTEQAQLLTRIKAAVENILLLLGVDAELTFVTQQMFSIVVPNAVQFERLKALADVAGLLVIDEFEFGIYCDL